MRKVYKLILGLSLVVAISTVGYFTHRLWVFAGKVSKAFEYTYSAVDCLIQQSGGLENDVHTLRKGFKSKSSYMRAANKAVPGMYSKEDIENADKHHIYNENIPECKSFYSEQRCWMLDPENEKSVINCGPHFGYTEDDIKKFKADPSKGKEISDEVFERRAKESVAE